MSDIERRKLLGAYKRGLTPSGFVRERNAVAIAAKMAAASAGAGAAGTTAAAKGTLGSKVLQLAASAKVKWMLLFVATSGLAIGVYEFGSTRPSMLATVTSRAAVPASAASASTMPSSSAVALADARVVPASPAPSTPLVIEAPSPAAAATSARPRATGAPEPASASSRGARSAGVATVSASPTANTMTARASIEPSPSIGSNRSAPASSEMIEEIALVRAMHEALAAQAPARAIALADEHSRRFPQGRLGLEVEGLRIVAECRRTGSSAETMATADAFVQSHPLAPVVDRVRSACRTE